MRPLTGAGEVGADTEVERLAGRRPESSLQTQPGTGCEVEHGQVPVPGPGGGANRLQQGLTRKPPNLGEDKQVIPSI